MFMHVLKAKPAIREALGGTIIAAWMYVHSFVIPLTYAAIVLLPRLFHCVELLQRRVCLRGPYFGCVHVHQGDRFLVLSRFAF